MSSMTREAFVTATASATWADIDALVAMLDGEDFWDEAFLAESIDAHKKSYIRREIKQIKTPDGDPVFASVTATNPETGEEERRYKQEAIFDRDDYAQTVRYHRRRADHHMQMAAGYARRGHERYGLQLNIELVTH